MSEIAIIVHGGARTIPEDEFQAHRDGCTAAVEAGWAVLEGGGSAVDALEAAIRILENDPTFNAGYGSELNADGDVQMDAGLMESRTLDVGAVAAIMGVRNPISVARKVLESEQALLVGDGARHFADQQDCELCDPKALIHEKQLKKWQESQENPDEPLVMSNTVGCVALDREGRIAAGASTGGTGSNPKGRVGDTALAGCGFYAEESKGGCSMTGDGEQILRMVLARQITDGLAGGTNPDSVVREAIAEMERRVGGEAGAIVLDKDGTTGWEHNSDHMSVGYRTASMAEPRAYVIKSEERDAS